eukprot:m.213906 g.213906  ORF g.213906 m.213906 type:complete len:210 (+) comp54047_c0_seq13:538-1167(+)
MKATPAASEATVIKDDERKIDPAEFQKRLEKEKRLRYEIIRSIGDEIPGAKTYAQTMFEKHCAQGRNAVSIKDLKLLCYELGYWLGSESVGAQAALDSGGSASFIFRDFVTWWSQSTRTWLWLLDDDALKQRCKAAELFIRHDPSRIGKVIDDEIPALIKQLRTLFEIKKPETTCRQGLDPSNSGVILFNNYIDWLGRMKYLMDQPPSM